MMTAAAAKKATAPSAEERAVALWNELDDAGRAALIDTLESLCDAGLTQKAELKKGGSIPHLWYRGQWLAKTDSVVQAYRLAVRGG